MNSMARGRTTLLAFAYRHRRFVQLKEGHISQAEFDYLMNMPVETEEMKRFLFNLNANWMRIQRREIRMRPGQWDELARFVETERAVSKDEMIELLAKFNKEKK